MLLPLPSCSTLRLGCTVGAGNCMPGVGTQGAGLCNLPRLSSNRLEVEPGACPQGSSKSHNRPAQHSKQHTRLGCNSVLLSPAAGCCIRREVDCCHKTAVNSWGLATARVNGTCNQTVHPSVLRPHSAIRLISHLQRLPGLKQGTACWLLRGSCSPCTRDVSTGESRKADVYSCAWV